MQIRNPNVFEKMLLVIGILVIIMGYFFIHFLASKEMALSWPLLQAVFLWLILVVLIILAAVNENTKEELKIVIQNQLDEIKLLRQELKKKK